MRHLEEDDVRAELEVLRDVAPVPEAMRDEIRARVWEHLPTPAASGQLDPSVSGKSVATHLLAFALGGALGAAGVMWTTGMPNDLPTSQAEQPGERRPPTDSVAEGSTTNPTESPEATSAEVTASGFTETGSRERRAQASAASTRTRPRVEESATPDAEETAPLAEALSTDEGTTRLAAERRIIDAARAALMRRNPEAALRSLARHATDFEAPQLKPEADALRIRALVLLGRLTEACDLANRFEDQHSTHSLAGSVRALAATRCDRP